MRGDRPTFAVVTPADADARRFIDLDAIRSLSGIPSTGAGSLDDEALGLKLDAVLASCATSCRLAKFRGLPLTLAQEVVRATWVDASVAVGWGEALLRYGRNSQLLLPWRAPITALTVTEGGTELVEDTDFRNLGAGVLERITGGVCCGWSFGAIVVDYTAGWLLDDEENAVPADLVSLIADQVRLAQSQSTVNPILRSEDIPGVWSGTFNMPGGDAIDTSGLSRPLYDALSDYRAPPSFA